MKASFTAFLVVLALGNRSRLLQETQCRTVTEGNCYKKVDWAMKTGIHQAPQWYPGLDTTSSWEEFQQYFHERPNLGGNGNDCPMPCPSERVICRTTIDNFLTHVRYNGKSLNVVGDTDRWESVKTFAFNPVSGAYLEIGGYELADCNGCKCSGFLLECDNGFYSNTEDWTAVGSSAEVVGPTNNFGPVCESTSGFYLRNQNSNAQKIWPSDGSKYAWFRAVPFESGRVICRTTIDNFLTHVRYNGEALNVLGDTDRWESVKTFAFKAVSGAYLEIGGYELADCNGCKCSGLLLECDNGFYSNTEDWTALGSSVEVVGATNNFGPVCESTSGFYLRNQNSNAQKIWPSDGSKYALFRAVPFERNPTALPTHTPTSLPSSNPTKIPTSTPSISPSLNPSSEPSRNPSFHPTSTPSMPPSSLPSMKPSSEPSLSPTQDPTSNPSFTPTSNPTFTPSHSPTSEPTNMPSFLPSTNPSDPSLDSTVDSSENGLLNEGKICWGPCGFEKGLGFCDFCGTGACCNNNAWFKGVPGCELAEGQHRTVCGDFSAPYPIPAEFRLGMPLGTAETPQTFPDVETQVWIGDITGEEDDADSVPEYDGVGGAPWSKSEMSLVRDLIVHEIRLATPERDEVSGAKFVRLAFHDCLKYTDGSGGCDGALNWDHMGEELVGSNGRVDDREYLDHQRKSSNNGLQHAVEFLERIYNLDFGHTFGSGCWATPATITGGDPIGDTSQNPIEVTSEEQCRQECLNHQDCTFFTVPHLQFLNAKGECRLFSDSGTIMHSSAGSLITGRAECPHESWSLRSRGKSRADLWAFASLVAIEEGISRHNAACDGDRRQHGGPVMCVQFEGEEGCKIEPDRPFVFKTGRKDCTSTTDEPYKTDKREAFPDEHFNGTMTVRFMEEHFGFSGRETVAIMGAHTMGRFKQKQTGHKYVWTTDFYAFNNQFYRNIAGKDDWFFDDNECTKVGDAWNNKGHAIWIAKMNQVFKTGGPIQWIQKKVVCPNCAAKSYERNHNRHPERLAQDRDCCLNKPEGAFCRPDNFGPHGSSVFERDNDFSEGCEYSHFIFGKDEAALGSDMGLYHKFDVDIRGFPSGCPGLKTFFPSGDRFSDWTCGSDGRPRFEDPSLSWDDPNLERIEDDEWTQRGCPADCDKQDYIYPGDETTLADYVERYADDQAAWINDFIPTMEKMIQNGYTDGELIAVN